MKKKFEYMMRYFKSLDCGELEMRLDIDHYSIAYQDITCKNRSINELPSAIQQIFDEIFEMYSKKLYKNGPGSTKSYASDYFYVDIIIDTKNERLIFTDVDFTEYETESSGTYYEFEDTEEGESVHEYFLKIREYLSEQNLNEIQLKYEGSGDSGFIEDYCETDRGSDTVPKFLYDIAYNLLEEFGGWEINEGSQGTIIITADDIEVQHEWNTEESYTNTVNIQVTKDSFDE